MNFHDNRGMYDDIAKWLEENDVEVDWEAIMQCKWWVGPKDWVPPPKWSMPAPFPSRLTPPIATKLLFAQWWHGLHIRPELGDPLDDYVPPRISDHQNVVPRNHQQRGGEGVDTSSNAVEPTGPNSWKIFLKQLAAIDRIEIIELKLIKSEDRRALVRMAWIEEELRRREVEDNRERVRRQGRGEAKFYLSRKGAQWLYERARRGNLESIEELERRGIWGEGEHRRWRETNAKLVKNMAKTRAKKVAKDGSGSNEGEADTEARGTVMGGAVRMEKPAGPLAVATEVSGEEGMVGERVKRGIERDLEVIRVGPNPRILTCRYLELASERTCKVGVKSVANFVRGMRFKMVEPLDEIEYAGVWRYDGRLPRGRGRW
jgi:hypothetical protein